MFLNTFHLCLFSFFSASYYFRVYIYWGLELCELSLLMTNVFHGLYASQHDGYVLCFIIYFVLAWLTYIWLVQIDWK